MKPMKAALISLGALAVCIALIMADRSFSQNDSQTKSQSSEMKNAGSASSGKEVVIGHLQTRDKVVTISTGKKGAVYTVKTKDGKTLHANLAEKDFQQKYPALYEQVKTGMAGNDASLRKTTAPVLPSDATK